MECMRPLPYGVHEATSIYGVHEATSIHGCMRPLPYMECMRPLPATKLAAMFACCQMLKKP